MSQPDWGQVFDSLAPVYDTSGVPFFGPLARALVADLGVGPGERVAELGAGRGAATLPLAEAVGPGGRVDAVDLSPQMVALCASATAHLPQVRVTVGDAADPPLGEAAYDVVVGALVAFFLPDPAGALRRWRRLVVPGGRCGVSSFAAPTPSWAAMETVFIHVLGAGDPADLRGGGGGAFGSDAGAEQVLVEAGWDEVATRVHVHDVPFRDVDQWQDWVQGTALRALWVRLDEAGVREVRSRVGELLAAEGGRLQVAIRHTTGRR